MKSKDKEKRDVELPPRRPKMPPKPEPQPKDKEK